MSKNNPISKLFNFILYFQMFLFFVFIIENINNLDEIEVSFEISGITSTININFYAFLIVVGVIMLISMGLGTSIFGSGLNSTATNTASKAISYTAIYSIISLGTLYYLDVFGWLGSTLTILFTIIFGLYMIQSTPED